MVDLFDRLRDMPDEQFRISLKERLMQLATTPDRPSYMPEGLRSVTPYLITSNAAGVIDFMRQTFDATEKLRVPAPGGKLMHGEVILGDSMIELSDGSDRYPPAPTALHVYVPDVDATYARAVFAGATPLFEPADQEYGDRAAAVRDTSGNNWYLATHLQRPGEYLPEGMHSVTPFLHARGADGQIRFLIDGFGGEELRRHEVGGRIAYARVRVGSGVIELSEAREEWPPMPASIHLYVPDCDAVYQQALAAGGTSIDPPTDQPYGERSGGVLDAFGNRWWIATYTGKMAE